jgi:hypoxanthine phosphoribosyltransferase
MTLKLMLISVDGTFVHNKQIRHDIAEQLSRLVIDLAKVGVKTALWSNQKWTINQAKPIDVWFTERCGVEVAIHGMAHDGSPARRMAKSAKPILDKYNVQSYETILVGGKEEDKIAGVNNQLLLLRPDWYEQQMDYGFPVNSVSELARFCFVFALRQHPIFWQIHEENLDISAAGPFSTMKANYAVFGGDARAFAKHGNGHPDFWFYFTVSSLYFSGLLDGVHYICSYPGHSPDSDPDKHGVASVLTRLGRCFHKSYYHDLIIRHTLAVRSHSMKAYERTLKAQLNTIQLRRKPHRNLGDQPNKSNLSIKGKTVLVVDDFVTSGRSSEAARLLIEAAGGTARLYSWLKTINSSYERVDQTVEVDPYSKTTIVDDPSTESYGYQENITAAEAPAEVQSIFDMYVNWQWPIS